MPGFPDTSWGVDKSVLLSHFKLLPVVKNAANDFWKALTGISIVGTVYIFNKQCRLKQIFLVTAVVIPLLMLCSVIYELKGCNHILSFEAAGLISVVMLWFSCFLVILCAPFSNIREQVHMNMVCVFKTSSSCFCFSPGSLCYPGSFVGAAGHLDRITSTQPSSPNPGVSWR